MNANTRTNQLPGLELDEVSAWGISGGRGCPIFQAKRTARALQTVMRMHVGFGAVVGNGNARCPSNGERRLVWVHATERSGGQPAR